MKNVKVKMSFSFYHKGIEYVIEAVNQNEARAIFYKLIKTK